MRTHLVSYADGKGVHLWNQRALLRSAAGPDFDALVAYRRRHLPEEFQARHRHILEQRRGAGCWLWKPYVIRDCLEHADEGDLVVYMDSGFLVRRSLRALLDQARRAGLLLVRTSRSNEMHVKRDCFALTETDTPECHRASHLDAAFIALTNTAVNRDFVETWLGYCTDARILTDQPNECGRPNLPEYVEHRHDQAVLSVLAWRERDRLPHAFCERRALRDCVWHHRRKSSDVPISVWHHAPRPVSDGLARGVVAFRSGIESLRRKVGRGTPPSVGELDPKSPREG